MVVGMSAPQISIDPGALTAVIGPQVTTWLQNRMLTPIASLAFATCPVGQPDPLGRPRVDPPMRYQINTRIEGDGFNQVGVVVCNSPHAVFVCKGTVDHDIPTGGAEAQKAKGYRLRFVQDGTIRMPWGVHHPGTTANPFMTDAMRAVVTGG